MTKRNYIKKGRDSIVTIEILPYPSLHFIIVIRYRAQDYRFLTTRNEFINNYNSTDPVKRSKGFFQIMNEGLNKEKQKQTKLEL